MHSQRKSWTATRLWQLLQHRTQEADAARQLLTNVMPDIETVLAKGGTSPVDFALHDEEHAFRVAERMIDLLPEDVAAKLTPLEFALLVLSAYLHDIGMTPTRDVVKKHYEYILTKSDGLLSDAEARELQQWLDETHGGLELPVSKGLMTVAGLERAEELLAYYCRHRHNDWSETWTREHLSDARPALYLGWVDDLVNLCRSHHEGLEALRQDRFQARYRGNPPQVVNLRYLAALLRVADVMEFDPERTPDVIIAHRDIAPKSRVFWYKDRFTGTSGSSASMRSPLMPRSTALASRPCSRSTRSYSPVTRWRPVEPSSSARLRTTDVTGHGLLESTLRSPNRKAASSILTARSGRSRSTF
jgi:hypothetical protein